MRCERLSVLIVFFVMTSRLTERFGIAQVAAAGQSGTSNRSKLATPEANVWDSAENRWRYQAVDLSAQVDPITPGLRQKRNENWSRVLADLLDMEIHGLHVLPAEGSPPRGDLVPDPQAIWVVANFEGYTVVPVDPKCLVMYTEIHFRIEQVIRQPKLMSLSPNGQIDVDLIGGRIKTPAGELRSFAVSPRSPFVQPGNKYLLNLKYLTEGSFYVMGTFWKVENGTLTSGYPLSSPLIGHTVDDVASQLASINPAAASK